MTGGTNLEDTIASLILRKFFPRTLLCYNTPVFQVRADEGRSYFRAEVKTWGQVCPRFRAQDME